MTDEPRHLRRVPNPEVLIRLLDEHAMNTAIGHEESENIRILLSCSNQNGYAQLRRDAGKRCGKGRSQRRIEPRKNLPRVIAGQDLRLHEKDNAPHGMNIAPDRANANLSDRDPKGMSHRGPKVILRNHCTQKEVACDIHRLPPRSFLAHAPETTRDIAVSIRKIRRQGQLAFCLLIDSSISGIGAQRDKLGRGQHDEPVSRDRKHRAGRAIGMCPIHPTIHPDTPALAMTVPFARIDHVQIGLNIDPWLDHGVSSARICTVMPADPHDAMAIRRPSRRLARKPLHKPSRWTWMPFTHSKNVRSR
ncbi:MAG: hypothetical protein QM753_13565 [Thermomicrobiales bacterium]